MDVDPRTGLFSSSLVHQPTSPETPERRTPLTPQQKLFEKRCEVLEREWKYRTPPANDVEVAFRHGSWIEDRDRVRAALVAVNVPVSRIERFDGCGGQCRVEYSPSAQKYRLRANYCGDRFCSPCMMSRSKKIAAAMAEWTQGETLRFLTLTLKKSSQPLSVIQRHLMASFTRLRAHGFWKKSVRAGTAVVEITRGAAGDHWHVHLHVLTVGSWLDQRELSDGWSKANGGSPIVDVRMVRDHEVGIGYVCKYATKGWSSDVLADPDSLQECILALRGKRLLVHFGEWYDRDDLLCKAQPQDFKTVGYIRQIYSDALEKKPWAVNLLKSLGFACGVVAGQPVFIGVPQSWSGP